MSHLDEGQLHSLLDGELNEAERRAAEAHLAACAECRHDYEEAKALLAETDDLIDAVELPRREQPAGDITGQAPRPIGPRFRWRTVAWAASLVLAVGLGWFARSGPLVPRQGETDSKVAAEPAAAPAPPPAPAQLTVPAAPAAEKAASALPRRRLDQAPTAGAEAETAPPRLEESLVARDAAAGARPAAAPTAPAPIDRAARPEVGALANAAPAPGRQGAPIPQAKYLADSGRIAPPLEAAEVDVTVPGAPLGKAEERKGYKDAALLQSRTAGGFQVTAMESAVRILGGSIRLVDGLTPTRVLVGPGAQLPGADGRLEVVRVVYMDPPGRELWLDQQRPEEPSREVERAEPSATTLLPGDTLLTPGPAGTRSLKWVHQSGFRLALTGFLPADSLRALARRVQ